MNKIWFRYN